MTFVRLSVIFVESLKLVVHINHVDQVNNIDNVDNVDLEVMHCTLSKDTVEAI